MAPSTAADVFLQSALSRFQKIKKRGQDALAQVRDHELHWSPHPECNSVAILIRHLHGNMMSRWTDFLGSDGEKPWRDRDREFVSDSAAGRGELMERWEEGWACLFAALAGLGPDDVTREVLVRGDRLSVVEAILGQLDHYAAHVGQIVFIAKELRGSSWKTLSIPRGASSDHLSRGRD
jgi:hypothetical protein